MSGSLLQHLDESRVWEVSTADIPEVEWGLMHRLPNCMFVREEGAMFHLAAGWDETWVVGADWLRELFKAAVMHGFDYVLIDRDNRPQTQFEQKQLTE